MYLGEVLCFVGERGVAQIGRVWTRVHGAGEGRDTPCANETSTGI